MPTLSIVRSVAAATRMVTNRPKAGDQIRLRCKFGKKRRLRLFLACDTLHPLCTPFALKSQRRAITHSTIDPKPLPRPQPPSSHQQSLAHCDAQLCTAIVPDSEPA